MPVAKNTDTVTTEEYLKAERINEVKHEYVDGYLYAMASASPNHGRIAANLMRCFGVHLHNTSCEPFCADLMLKTATGNCRYPDVLVTCDNEFIDEGRVTQTSVIIVEIISRSTRKIDESAKKLEYINIPTLKEYVLIEQDIAAVRVLRKSDDWRTSSYFLGDEVYFESIDLTLSVEAIYYRVENKDIAEFLAG